VRSPIASDCKTLDYGSVRSDVGGIFRLKGELLMLMSQASRQAINNHIGAVGGKGSAEDIIAALRRVGSLGELSPAAIRDLAGAVAVEKFERDQVIYNLGEPANSFYMVSRGRVLISSFSSSGKTLLTVKGLFDTFGELLVAQNLQAQCRAHAHIDTQVYRVSESDFVKLCYSYPELALAFTKLVAERWRRKREDLEDMIFLSAQQRALKLLAKLSNGFEEHDWAAGNPLLQFSQEEFSQMVGVTRERVNFILNNLERDGIVRIHHRALRVDRERLRLAMSEESLTT
jgi:CRP/FNR family cyclic AMP-dependent transcriptional regulator